MAVVQVSGTSLHDLRDVYTYSGQPGIVRKDTVADMCAKLTIPQGTLDALARCDDWGRQTWPMYDVFFPRARYGFGNLH